MTDALKITVPGTIEVEGEKVYVHAAPTKRGEKRYPVPAQRLTPAGASSELLDGQPAKVTWDRSEGRIDSVAVRVPDTGPVSLRDKDGFLNPYAFVSIPDRETLPPELHDRQPVGHDRYLDDRWTGTIAVTVRTRTPLLLPDHARAALETARPAPLPVRVDDVGRPLLAGSAVKGALRSAYEAITNSRLGVFDEHDQQLAIRGTADRNVAERLHPAYVGDNGDSIIATSLRPSGQLPEHLREKQVQPAVWVPRRLACETGCGETGSCREPGGRHCAEPRGRRVAAWLYLAQGPSLFWRVLKYADPGTLPDQPPEPPAATRSVKPVAGYPPVRVVGRIHWTGSTLPAGGGRKHDERMVVEEVIDDGLAELDPRELPLTTAHHDAWQAVIDSYARAHEHEDDDLRRRNYGGYVAEAERWRKLRAGDTLYVELDSDDQPTALYPAMIGRKPFPGAPGPSLPDKHRPAGDRGCLSPADRVFGWVPQGSDDTGVAHRGHLRVLPPDDVGTPGPECVWTFPQPVPLTTLNSPKPSQFRFYLGDADGGPLTGVAKEPQHGYPAESGTRRLRGRKVYLTHAEVLDDQTGAVEYWTPPRQRSAKPELVTVGGRERYREYLRPWSGASGSEDSDVVTWISGWVSPGATFQLELQVDNLDDTELGALLWLLALPGDGCHKLSLGKPLGFGAVRVDVDWGATKLYSGEHLRDRYRTLNLQPEPASAQEAKALADAYDDVLRQHLSSVRTEFLNAARGFTDAPVHYPRLGEDGRPSGTPPPPETTTYKWWVENDRVGGVNPDKGVVLGRLDDPDSLLLPYQPSRNGSGGGRNTPPRKRRRDR